MTFSSAIAKLSVPAFLAVGILFSPLEKARAASFTINFNTGIAGKTGVVSGQPDPLFTWNYTGNYEDTRYQAYTCNSRTWIMPCTFSNSNYGPDVPVGTPPFRGVAYLYYTFDLPENATNVQLDFNNLTADDRGVVSLNETFLGGFKFATTSEQGVMTDAGFNQIPTAFNPNGTPLLVNDPSLFNFGGQNVLRFWVNNTNTFNPYATAIPLVGPGDRVHLTADGTLSYETKTQSVPEPASVLGLLALGTFGVTSRLLKHQKQPKNLDSQVN